MRISTLLYHGYTLHGQQLESTPEDDQSSDAFIENPSQF